MFIIDTIESGLKTTTFGRTLRYHESVGSTNTVAAAWAEAGAAEGSVVLAEYQTQGRGRLGRTWQAAAGLNLMFSVVLRPTLPPDRLGLISLAAGVALAEAIREQVPSLDPQIKWPNDVLISNRKCCGLLLEASHTSPSNPTIILGIGLNVNQIVFPSALAHTATSLCQECGHEVPRGALLATSLNHLERTYASLSEDGGRAMQARYTAAMYGMNTAVHFRRSSNTRHITGTVRGVDKTGALRLEIGGIESTFHAGEISFS